MQTNRNDMKVEKSVSMHSHAFEGACKRKIVTDPKSRNASHNFNGTICPMYKISVQSQQQQQQHYNSIYYFCSIVLTVDFEPVSAHMDLNSIPNLFFPTLTLVKLNNMTLII